ncbi:hypothetical protein BKI49_28655 [Streptomyces sp. Tue6028]|uniref:hypothetical protein n=1 Tax=Streptomyces sp. Tue6028 TaxID=2036037 RepID=UPI000BB31D16|nr:hypothetical protein [Streptomyces sp. Tue6028]PBC60484.1 hypothetical protein BKI49_28655 [Streptomyces sp. Tue6028]
MTDNALRLLRQDPHLAGLAAFPFGFDLSRAAHGHVEPVRLASGGPLEVVAGDDTGGTYFLCADGSMLYADSEGGSGIVGSSADEALEIFVGLPGWHDYLGLSPQDGAEKILAAVAETEDELRECYGFDDERTEMRAALGFPERSPVELVGMLYAALRRTEPDFVLIHGEELLAYRLLDELPGPPLWEAALARGHADLARLRAGEQTVEDAPAEDPVRRRVALRAAQFDRADDDTGLLRRLLRHEARTSMTDELRLAAVLVGLRGDPADLPLLHEVRDTDFDTRCGLGGIPEPDADGAALRSWARDLDESLFGTDPADEPLFTWTELALDQGLTELARVALIRHLDEIEMNQNMLRRPDAPTRLDPSPLGSLARGFERLGDLPQALRAQRLFARLQERAWNQVSARLTEARLEREAARLDRAVSTLGVLRGVLAAPGDDSLRHWQGVNLGRFIAEEHYALAHALADADLPEEARAVLAAGDAIRDELSPAGAAAVRQPAEEAARRTPGRP